MKKKFYFEYIVFKVFYWLIIGLPEQAAYGLGIIIGKLAYLVDVKHKKIAYDNIALVLNIKKATEIEKIIKSSYRNLGLNLVEFLRLRLLNKEWQERHIEIMGQQFVEKALEKGKGVVFLVSHFGNWELMGACGSIRLLENASNAYLYAVGRPMKNPLTDELIHQIRIASGIKILPKKNVLQELLQKLRENQTVGILADQNAGHEGIFVDFLGKEASTVTSPIVLAFKTGAAIIPVFMIREGISKHKMIVEQPLEIKQKGDFYFDLYENTQKFTKKIEEYVRKYPSQWFWLHQRWKTKKQEVKRLRFKSIYDKLKKVEPSIE